MKKLVVIVEDDWAVRLDLMELFEDADWEVVAFPTGDAAIERGQACRPELLVTDINLPGSHDGLAVAATFRETFPGVTVVYYSGTPPDHARLVPGATYLSKPVLGEELLRAASG